MYYMYYKEVTYTHLSVVRNKMLIHFHVSGNCASIIKGQNPEYWSWKKCPFLTEYSQ